MVGVRFSVERLCGHWDRRESWKPAFGAGTERNLLDSLEVRRRPRGVLLTEAAGRRCSNMRAVESHPRARMGRRIVASVEAELSAQESSTAPGVVVVESLLAGRQAAIVVVGCAEVTPPTAVEGGGRHPQQRRRRLRGRETARHLLLRRGALHHVVGRVDRGTHLEVARAHALGRNRARGPRAAPAATVLWAGLGPVAAHGRAAPGRSVPARPYQTLVQPGIWEVSLLTTMKQKNVIIKVQNGLYLVWQKCG